MQQIALVDISGAWEESGTTKAQSVAAVREACETVGFFCLRGHRIPGATIQTLRERMVAFFARPLGEKQRLAIAPGLYRGYIPLGALNANAGTAAVRDHYEGFKLHAEATAGSTLVPPNIWPDAPRGFRAAVLAYWRAADALSLQLLRFFALALELPEAAFLAAFEAPMTNMTLLHYPPMAGGQDGFGIHPHKDSDAFTILVPDPVGGLEVRPIGGDWILADCPGDAVVVNIGNMMELWSGGRFRSTPHRVINRSGAERYSFPYFAVPNQAVQVSPLVPPLPGFDPVPLEVGSFMAEIYRTNRADQAPRDPALDLGTLDS